MLQWFQRLIPRQDAFFPAFERHAAVMVKTAVALREMIAGGDQLKPRFQEILDLEHEADGIAREVLLGLRTTFITPFDRADIQSLITSMDDFVDQCKATAKAIMLFEMTSFEPDMRKMADAVVDCAELAQRAVALLSDVAKNAAALNESCLQITRIEGDADDAYDRGLELLYQKAKGGDALEFIRGSEIYKHLEDTVDSLDDIADEISRHRYRARLNATGGPSAMPDSLLLLVALVAVALIFDFLNGLHDAANSIATVVSTRVLSPNVAVVWAAFFNFVAFLFFGLHVAQTVGTGIISSDIVDGQVIFGALMGAIVWNLLTWWGAIPSSSSHALIGGLIGAGAAKAGFSAVVWWGTLKTVAAIVWSPLLGFALALLLWLVLAWLLMRSTPFAVDQKFRVLQLGSAALYSIGHGANDAQKTMGIIASLLFAKGLLGSAFYVPFWVVLSCQVAMALGTLIGGWRIVKTMGSRITRLKPVQGFCAETAGAMTLYLATSFGVPVSTTHTITGAIMGVGAARRVSAVRWGIAGSIIIAWVITLPAAALIGALFYKCATLFAAAA